MQPLFPDAGDIEPSGLDAGHRDSPGVLAPEGSRPSAPLAGEDLMVTALGTLTVTREGQDVPIAKSKARAVLAALLIHRESLVPADILIEEVWGARPPDSARHGLHVAISSLRSVFGCHRGDGACRLVSTPAGYHLDLETDEFDVAIAEGLVRIARAEAMNDHLVASESTFLAAESWFRNPPYAEFTYDEFAQPEIRRITELHWGAREDRIAVQIGLGRHQEIIPELEGLVAKHPTRERLLRQLMLALCRSGRPADALGAFEETRRTLDAEYGCPPGRETVDLAERIRRSGTAVS
ncbi:MAG: BTAD domain-containing putative transcriptional regulator [Acidimicrobiia bacterium]|nr:BTAD domain-containing putative transcriptional regulator [Acidimicrobiia bacterium]